jgi:hypothetical protein
MPSLPRQMKFLTLFVFASAASACGNQERIQPAFPPLADLSVEPKPVPPPEIVTSAQAAAEYDIAVEGWGERGWRTVARICRWAKEQGLGVDCPQP